ncbi:MAG: hypothetical protein FWD80_02405 [Propionibacteriaceae bacterium]|nr:hypothetical protein [Propionibacteriaceae bacterium]
MTDPPEQWLDAMRWRSQGCPGDLDGALEQTLSDHNFMLSSLHQYKLLVIGGGLLAAEIALGLAQAGITVQISASEAAPVGLDPMGFHTSAAAAVRAWVLERLPAAKIETGPHWTALTDGCCDLVVVAPATVQPDRAITDHLARHWLPHLIVRAHCDTAVVGPLVDHQGGPCMGCLDLSLADHDELWPTTAAALTTRVAYPDQLTAHWAGAQAAMESAWFLRGSGTTLRTSTLEADAKTAGLARRRWSPHPQCACRYTINEAIDLRRAA